MNYNALDWYWSVAGDMTQLWSSKALSYVSPDDPNFQQFLHVGNSPTRIDSADSLVTVMSVQVMPSMLSQGLRIVSNSRPDTVNGTYGLDPDTMAQIGSLARDVGAGLGLPLGNTSFAFPDVNGALHTLTEDDVQNVYKALRDYSAQLFQAVILRVNGNAQSIPVPPVTIP